MTIEEALKHKVWVVRKDMVVTYGPSTLTYKTGDLISDPNVLRHILLQGNPDISPADTDKTFYVPCSGCGGLVAIPMERVVDGLRRLREEQSAAASRVSGNRPLPDVARRRNAS